MDNVTKLKEYKELLDQGVITPEQFVAIKKEILNNIESTPTAQPEMPYIQPTSINLNPNDPEPAINRIKLFLEDGKWNDALQYCDAALDLFPTNSNLYMLKYCAQNSIPDIDKLDGQPFENLAKDSAFQTAVRFSGDGPEDAKAIYEKALQKDYKKTMDSLNDSDASSLKSTAIKLQSLLEAAHTDFDVQFIDDSLSKIKTKLSVIAVNLYNDNDNNLKSLNEAKDLFDFLGLSVQSKFAEEKRRTITAKKNRRVIYVVAGIIIVVSALIGAYHIDNKKRAEDRKAEETARKAEEAEKEEEICSSLSGKTYIAVVDDWGNRYCEFGDDGRVHTYSIDNEGETWGDDDEYYEVRKLDDDQYAIDITSFQNMLFNDDEYRYIVTDIEGTQITGFRGVENIILDGHDYGDHGEYELYEE